MKKRPPPARPDSPARRAWELSPEFRAIALDTLRRVNARKHLIPRCGAKARSTGQPCKRIPAPGRKRCLFHGGATPRGDGPAGWHTPGFPDGLPPRKASSASFKQKRRRELQERRDALTPEQQAQLEEWRRTHEAGSTSKRARRRTDRAAAEWLRDLMEQPRRPSHPQPAEAACEPTTLSKMEHEDMGKPNIDSEDRAELTKRLHDEGASIGLETLMLIARDTNFPAGARVLAARELVKLSGVGADASDDEKSPDQMSRAELEAAARAIRAKLADLEQGDRPPSVFD
ncbi:hypothetical protein LPLAFNJD_LOCUS2894 [Methylorubrum aminovorans]